MKLLRYIIIYVSALLAVQVAVAQTERPTITSHLSADTVMIGDSVTLTVEVEKDVMQHIIFPSFDFKSTAGAEQSEPSIEVIHDFAPDTLSQEGRRVRLRKRYEMAVFDEGIYRMGKAQVLLIDKTLSIRSLPSVRRISLSIPSKLTPR